jgi:hypothetical protein
MRKQTVLARDQRQSQRNTQRLCGVTDERPAAHYDDFRDEQASTHPAEDLLEIVMRRYERASRLCSTAFSIVAMRSSAVRSQQQPLPVARS